MGGTITLAGSSLESTYHKMFDTILNSSAGTVLTNIGLAAAVLLALGLIVGGICKALGRQNKIVQMFCRPSVVFSSSSQSDSFSLARPSPFRQFLS